VDAAVMERSLNELVRRHEILRVRFVLREEGPVQLVETDAPIQFTVTDLSSLEPDAREKTGLHIALETVREPFDLNAGPVLRGRLIRLATTDHLLCIPMHHVVSDGFTGSILLDDLVAIYDNFAAEKPGGLPDLALHFTDYAAWERHYMDGPRLEEQLNYWRSVLQNAPSSLDLPTDVAGSFDSDRRGYVRSIVIPDDLLGRLQSLAQTNGTTLFTVLAAALRVLLYRWSGQADFLLGTLVSNRSRTGTERLIGCFVNPLPLRNPVAGVQSAMTLLDKEKKAVMDGFAHQDCPFALIVKDLNPERTSNDNPLFNVALLFQNFPAIARSGCYFEAEQIDFDTQVALLDLRFIAMETSGGLQLSCEYKAARFSEDTVDTLLQGYAEVLRTVERDPARVVDDIELPQRLTEQAVAARARDHRRTIAIAASFTSQPIEERLNLLLTELEMSYRVTFTAHHDVLGQLLDPTSAIRASDGFAVVLLRLEDGTNSKLADDLITALREAETGQVPVILCFCPESRGAGLNANSREGFYRSLEAKVADAFANSKMVCVVPSAETLDLYPTEEYEASARQRRNGVPYTEDFFSALGTMLVRRIWGLSENRYKVIAIEADQVLWKGRWAEDGRVTVDEPRRLLQNSLIEQRNAGMLLCLCSRNSEKDIQASFDSDSDPAMPLRRGDMAANAINDRTYAENLNELAGELGMGLDRFIFLHTDEAECLRVEASCPEVLTLQMPTDPDAVRPWLKHVWAFDLCNRARRESGADLRDQNRSV
ncbi:MAG: FkbH like protein, partial [Bryobacterales bacterium]|nr:FkbH like protein [Bryobacterales bacterium]